MGPTSPAVLIPLAPFPPIMKETIRAGLVLVSELDTNEKCEKCGKPMVLRKGRFGTSWPAVVIPPAKYTVPRHRHSLSPGGCDGGLVERMGKGGRRFTAATAIRSARRLSGTNRWLGPVPGVEPHPAGKGHEERIGQASLPSTGMQIRETILGQR